MRKRAARERKLPRDSELGTVPHVKNLGTRFVLFAVALMASSACTTTSSLSDFDKPEFSSVIERYQGLAGDGERYLALATEANGRFAWGIAAGEASAAVAKQLAMERCAKAAKSGGMRADCFGFAVGDQPDPETTKGCYERRITSRRCRMQKTHQAQLGS